MKEVREEWRDIAGYEGKYQVSSLGRVRSIDKVINNRLFKGQPLKQRFKENRIGSYLTVNLKKNSVGCTRFVHKLVAEAFLPNPDNLSQVNHIDEDKTNNRVDNLEWCTAKYNANYGKRNENILRKRIEIGYVNPSMVGLDRKEYQSIYRKKYNDEHKEEMREYQKKYYLRKKCKNMPHDPDGQLVFIFDE